MIVILSVVLRVFVLSLSVFLTRQFPLIILEERVFQVPASQTQVTIYKVLGPKPFRLSPSATLYLNPPRKLALERQSAPSDNLDVSSRGGMTPLAWFMTAQQVTDATGEWDKKGIVSAALSTFSSDLRDLLKALTGC